MPSLVHSFPLPEQQVAARRWRTSALLAVALHALPVVVLAGHEAHALQAIEALRDEIAIELEPPLAPASAAGSEPTKPAARGEHPPPPFPVPPHSPEPPEATDEPQTQVTPAGNASANAEPENGALGPILTQGISGAGDGLFAGNGTGTLHAEICFIPETTRSLREIQSCPPIYEQYLDRINIPQRPFTAGFPGFPDRFEFFAVNIQGSFRVTQPGAYHFRLKADDGAQLFINDQLVVDNDGMHDAISRSGDVRLGTGQYRLRVWYFQGIRYELALQLFVTPPGGSEQIFSSEL
jgi:fibro-slime domain-containing protein